MSQALKSETGRVLRFDRSRAEGLDIRSYYARSIDEAVDRATFEIGPDAMLIDSRRSPAEARHIGEYEVRFAVPKEAKPANGKAAPPAADPDLASEVARMRSELGQMRELFQHLPGREPATEPVPAPSAGPSRLTQRLLDCGFSPELAAEIAGPVESATGRDQDAALDAELQRGLATLGSSRSHEASVVAFIGPPGCGKTTALIKMAVQHCASEQGPVILVNTDTFRIGATEQMARYAAILGVPLLTADTTSGLRQVLETKASGALLLIDTPGLSGGDMEMCEQVGHLLAGRQDIERHLIIPATMHSSDMARVRGRYEGFRPTHLAFTRLDETDRFGSLITATCDAGIPARWISAGQRVPDDLEAATPESLSRLVVARKWPADSQRRRETTS
jgi:flagellar biosynthesis protein FlhF